MKLATRLPRTAALPIASVLVIIAVSAFRPVLAATSLGESEAERYVLDQNRQGKEADNKDLSNYWSSLRDFGNLDEERVKVSASFIANLLTGRDPRMTINRKRILLRDAEISGKLDLRGQDIRYDLVLNNCTFENAVDFSGSNFAKGLLIWACDFLDSVNFTGATMTDAFFIDRCTFQSGEAEFTGMQSHDDVIISDSTFLNKATDFANMQVGGVFWIDDNRFDSENVSFAYMRVDGGFSAQRCIFNFDKSFDDRLIVRPNATVSFAGAHVGDFFLNESTFNNISTIDFTRLQGELLSFGRVESTTPSNIKLQLMTFKLLRPVKAKQLLQFLLSNYDPESYADVETFLRTHGYSDEADSVFIAKKRAERRQNCTDFLSECNRGAWTLSLFEDALAGYGKSLQNLLYWSLGFLFIGTFVFRSEKGMRTKDGKDAENYEGKYHAFWYSLDLFLPIIKLGEADVWTPKDYRRLANLYRRVHIIIGSLFVPIGLAAWTGIIK